MKIFPAIFFAFICSFVAIAQGSFPPDASAIGTTAIHKDSSVFISWASSCQVNRGWQNILDTTLGRASSGSTTNAIGKSGLNGTISLGDRGEAILSFNHPIINGIGFDFAVFENAFNYGFLELAFVEVSTNGTDYVRFPSYSETQTDSQIGGFDQLDATNIHNLAGKYKVGYGTPFDLGDLSDSSGIDINNINYVKIIDVIGIVNDSNASLDYNLDQINDPFPTPYPTSGFDLDAVGVIHQFVGVHESSKILVNIFPNPSSGIFTVRYTDNRKKEIYLYNSMGGLISRLEIESDKYHFNKSLPLGWYFLKTKLEGNIYVNKVIIQ